MLGPLIGLLLARAHQRLDLGQAGVVVVGELDRTTGGHQARLRHGQQGPLGLAADRGERHLPLLGSPINVGRERLESAAGLCRFDADDADDGAATRCPPITS